MIVAINPKLLVRIHGTEFLENLACVLTVTGTIIVLTNTNRPLSNPLKMFGESKGEPESQSRSEAKNCVKNRKAQHK